MPCSDSLVIPNFDDSSYKKTKEEKEYLDKITNYLCKTCAKLEENGISIDAEVNVWWRLHKENDRLRKENK